MCGAGFSGSVGSQVRIGPAITFLVFLAACGGGALIVRSSVAAVGSPEAAPKILALASPRETERGERYVAYGGARLDNGGSLIVRVCAPAGGCPIRRTVTEVDGDDFWGWLATFAPSLPTGQYVGEVFARGPGILGAYRTAEHFSWLHHVD